jgi:hypothetical protein
VKVLVACEFSGVVRDAFIRRGHAAVSCDLLPSESEGPHIQGDVFDVLNKGWDALIFHWPCTYLLFSGKRWLNTAPSNPSKGKVYGELRRKLMNEHAHCFKSLLESGIQKIAGENPRMCLEARAIIGEPSQMIRPWWFGDDATKSTFLWLRGLPPLMATNTIQTSIHTSRTGRKWDKWFFDSSCISNLEERSRFRSRTFPGIAKAMAEQWG